MDKQKRKFLLDKSSFFVGGDEENQELKRAILCCVIRLLRVAARFGVIVASDNSQSSIRNIQRKKQAGNA